MALPPAIGMALRRDPGLGARWLVGGAQAVHGLGRSQ